MFSLITKPIGCLVSLLSTLVIITVAVVLVVVVAASLLIPKAIVTAVETRTGYGMMIESSDVSLLRARLSLDNAVLTNPTGAFPATTDFLKAHRILIDADTLTLDQQTVALDAVQIDIDRLVLVRDGTGGSNLQRFAAAWHFAEAPLKTQDGPNAESVATGETASPAEVRFLIRSARVRLGTVRIVDAQGSVVREMPLEYRREFTGEWTPEALAAAVAGDLAQAGAGEVVEAFYAGLEESVHHPALTERFLDAARSLSGEGQEAGDALKDTLEKLF